MQIDLAPVRRGRAANARSFAGLMELYEHNYIRLRNMAPDLNVADEMISTVPRHQDLFLSITERCKYTTVLNVTQISPSEGLPGTTMSIRLYHDAKCAEVIAYQNERGFDAVYEYPNDKMRHRDEKAQVNRFLSEFLSMCLAHGVSNEEPIEVLSN